MLGKNRIERIANLDCLTKLEAPHGPHTDSPHTAPGMSSPTLVLCTHTLYPPPKVLDLHSNRISELHHLEALSELRVLNLAGDTGMEHARRVRLGAVHNIT